MPSCIRLIPGDDEDVITRAPPAEAPKAEQPKTLVAITACPTGIAHTYMAADSLVAAAKLRHVAGTGWSIA